MTYATPRGMAGMKPRSTLLIGLVIGALIAGGGGYWLGRQGVDTATRGTAEKTATAAGGAAKGERQPLYYRNPMGLPDTSPTPKKDPMGMDYIAVYAGDDEATADSGAASPNAVKLSADKIQKLGVRTEPATRRALERTVRASGRVEPDESRTFAISPKFEGYVERLHVNLTGQPVGKGQALFEAYSPELVAAQREYAIAAQGVDALKEAGAQTRSGMQQLAESSLLRLRNWDVSDDQLRQLAKNGEIRRTLTFRSPVGGIVTEKKALQGMRFMPGEALYQVTDLSSVWVVADIFEQDIGRVKPGLRAKVTLDAYPGQVFAGKVAYVYQTLKAETRSVPVRIELPNPGLLLKPSMFAQVEVPVDAREKALSVPLSAVIDSGVRQVILVQSAEGRFEPREVRLGARSDTYVEVLDGVGEGEAVVIAANFLIDAESNLKAALGAFGQSGPESQKMKSAPTKSMAHHAEGTIDEVDAKAAAITLTHGPVDSLKWPAMTMEFKLANSGMLTRLKAGDRVAVEFVERQAGEWVITELKPLGNGGNGGRAAAPAPGAHDQHDRHGQN